MKKLFILIFTLLIISTNVCFANQIHIQQATNVLQQMKIIIGNEHGDLMLENNLTRAEFATIIHRLLGLEHTKTPNTQIKFTDVDNDFWGYSAIYKCVDKGYLIGDGNGYFRPNDYIKYEEVLTIMLRIVNQANALSNWPNDYIEKANSLGIVKNTNYTIGDIVNRGNAFIIIYNCLDIKI